MAFFDFVVMAHLNLWSLSHFFFLLGTGINVVFSTDETFTEVVCYCAFLTFLCLCFAFNFL